MTYLLFEDSAAQDLSRNLQKEVSKYHMKIFEVLKLHDNFRKWTLKW